MAPVPRSVSRTYTTMLGQGRSDHLPDWSRRNRGGASEGVGRHVRILVNQCSA
jgi:hypothetical protein